MSGASNRFLYERSKAVLTRTHALAVLTIMTTGWEQWSRGEHEIALFNFVIGGLLALSLLVERRLNERQEVIASVWLNALGGVALLGDAWHHFHRGPHHHAIGYAYLLAGLMYIALGFAYPALRLRRYVEITPEGLYASFSVLSHLAISWRELSSLTITPQAVILKRKAGPDARIKLSFLHGRTQFLERLSERAALERLPVESAVPNF